MRGHHRLLSLQRLELLRNRTGKVERCLAGGRLSLFLLGGLLFQQLLLLLLLPPLLLLRRLLDAFFGPLVGFGRHRLGRERQNRLRLRLLSRRLLGRRLLLRRLGRLGHFGIRRRQGLGGVALIFLDFGRRGVLLGRLHTDEAHQWRSMAIKEDQGHPPAPCAEMQADGLPVHSEAIKGDQRRSKAPPAACA